MIGLLVLLTGCWRFPCETLEATGDCAVAWTACDTEAFPVETVEIACEDDDDGVQCTCARDGELRASWPEPAGWCAELLAAVDDDEKALQATAEKQCSL